ncbi:MAG: alanine racemase [Candidatus Paceibacterota bacterium]|jgi:alanine racemase
MATTLPLSYIELSQKNLVHNVEQFRKFLKKGTKIAAVVKGNAYGHGQNEVAKILEPYIDYFQVDDIEELNTLRKISRKRTLVFGYVQKHDLRRANKLGCILSVFSIEELLNVSAVAENLRRVQEIHLPIDAHLGREGFLLKDLPQVLMQIKKLNYIKLTGIYAHFANIEDTTDFSHAQKQINEYKKAVKLAEHYGFRNLQTHISATSGILAYEKSKGIHPIVRLGIGLYGMWPSENLEKMYKRKLKLRPVLTWKTKVAEIKTLPKGSTIGYGLTYKTKKVTKIALIPQGYSDGINRKLSNLGHVLIKGTRCKILGRVMMNMFSVDVSHIHNVKIEDEVVILGRQRKEEITAEEIAEKLDTINYEIGTKISPILPRVII